MVNDYTPSKLADQKRRDEIFGENRRTNDEMPAEQRLREALQEEEAHNTEHQAEQKLVQQKIR